MKFSKYISKAVTPVMALFQKQHSCLSNKATTICGYSVCSLRQVPVRHNRGGKSTENKVRLAPPTMCRLTIKIMKGNLARQLFLAHPELKKELWGGHLWNPSYCAVTGSDRSREQIMAYIEGQKEKENRK